MPHFVIDCSENILKQTSSNYIMEKVFSTVVSTGLFLGKHIIVRIHPFQYYLSGGKTDDFIHIFGNIMEGRTTMQKRNLSERIIAELKKMFPDVPFMSINIRDVEKATFCNKSMIKEKSL